MRLSVQSVTLVATALALCLTAAPPQAAAQDKTGVSPSAGGEAAGSPLDALSEIKEKLTRTEALIESSKQKEETVLSELEASDKRLAAVRQEAALAASKVGANRAKVEALEAEAASLEENLAQQQEALGKTLRRLYRQRTPSAAQVLLTATTLTEASEIATYTRRLAQMDRQRIARYRSTLKELNETRDELEATSDALAKERSKADRRERELRRHTRAKRTLLASIQKERLAHEEAQREMEAAAREVETMLTRLNEEKKASTLHTVESEREAKERAASFDLLKGRLPWPIEGRLLKTPERDALLHKGIYIEVAEGRPIEAVASGTVVFADYFKGYGNLIIIDHGTSYHTLYAHSQELLVKIGDKVAAGQAIGRAGSSGAASSPRLYFELRHRGRPINPIPWMVARSQ